METKNKILITGWLWYLGSHTVTTLSQAWFEVIIVDNLSNAHRSTFEHLKELCPNPITFYEADIRDLESLDEIFKKEEKIWVVLHFAWKTKKKESCMEPFLYYDVNIHGTINLLQLMDKYDIKNILYASSSSVYDTEKNIPPFSEIDKIKPKTPFGNTKIIVEQLLHDMTVQKGFNVIALRYFNTIGTHPSHKIGFYPKGLPTKIVPLLMKVAKGEIESFPIYGDNYKTKDGTCLMDYIHIMDVADLHVKIVQHLLNKESTLSEIPQDPLYEVVNVGTGCWRTIKEMIDLVELVTNKTVPYSIEEQRIGDADVILWNANKARHLFQWEPKKTIVEALDDAWKFELNETLDSSEWTANEIQ